ncbi:MAG: 2-C-methyl-D-erythritol 2,4-cyclodiphosphate synthase [Deltaproteobacteria bacterium]|nr:2-C-methyl-D-erythritol 2,4-cyclodiphosphate synthase [Deltaproteobacteria bacterium]
MAQDFRVGQGFDAHRLVRGRKLILGGVEIAHSKGLLGHSDADVVLHALVNALLGALGEGDIGSHFPDSDPRYKGVSSVLFLDEVVKIMRRQRWALVNADVSLIAQEPKLAPHYDRIKNSVAEHMRVAERLINVKAATTEKQGWIGRGQGMAALAVVLLRRK